MLAALVLLLLQTEDLPTTAPAPKAIAQQLLDEGSALYESGDAAAALRKFSAAYATFPSPKLWFNIGQALRALDRPVDALDAYERFIDGTNDVSEEVRAEALRAVADLRAELAGWILQCQPPAKEVFIDGHSVGRPPLFRPIWMAPGRHVLEVTSPGYAPFAATVHANAGRITRLPIILVREEPAVPVERAERNSAGPSGSGQRPYEHWSFWAVIGGIALIGGLALYSAK